MIRGMKKYKHISQKEREQLFLYHHQGKSNREIARLLKRNHRTIDRELKRNSQDYVYSAMEAQRLAKTRRSQAKIGVRKLDNPVLRRYVIKQVGKGWSPEQIAGRLQRINSNLAVCPETIYQFIYRKENRKLKLWELLRRQHRKRQLFNGRKITKQLTIPNRVFIDQRPEIVNQREEIGHWETDLMEGRREHKGHVSVVIERRSRLVKLAKVDNKKANVKSKSLINQLENMPRDYVKTITFDNGKENYQHQQISQQLNCRNYFCNPYHSWEKGSVENLIGLVRQYLPKRTDLATVSQGELSWIAWQLNNRPRKILGYQTPSEIFEKETGWVT